VRYRCHVSVNFINTSSLYLTSLFIRDDESDSTLDNRVYVIFIISLDCLFVDV
jgi:hypothetical protein